MHSGCLYCRLGREKAVGSSAAPTRRRRCCIGRAESDWRGAPILYVGACEVGSSATKDLRWDLLGRGARGKWHRRQPLLCHERKSNAAPPPSFPDLFPAFSPDRALRTSDKGGLLQQYRLSIPPPPLVRQSTTKPNVLSGASAGLPRSLPRLEVVGSVYLVMDGLDFEEELLGHVFLAACLVYERMVPDDVGDLWGLLAANPNFGV